VPEIKFWPIRFDVPSQDLGGFIETVSEHAVARTLDDVAHGRSDVKARWDHQTALTLGRTENGTLALSVVPRKGVRAAIDVNMATSFGRDALAAWTRGDITGGSFGFRILADEWTMQDGIPRRRIDDMIFSEVSLVSEPAYRQTEESASATASHPDAMRHDRAVAADVARRVFALASKFPALDIKFSCTYQGDGPHLALRSAGRRRVYPTVAMRLRMLEVERIEEELATCAPQTFRGRPSK
jgi:uncharacterized protein